MAELITKKKFKAKREHEYDYNYDYDLDFNVEQEYRDNLLGALDDVIAISMRAKFFDLPDWVE